MKQLILCDDCKPQVIRELCHKYGLGIEVQSFYDPEYLNVNPDAFEQHADYIKKIPVRYLHGPFGDLCPGSFDSMVRDVALNRFELAFSSASKLNIHNIILHVGYVPDTSPAKNWIKRCCELWKQFLKDKPNDITFYLENLFEKTPEFVSELIEQIDDSRVKVCLDIGHAYCHSNEDVVTWVEHLGDKIRYVHMHNNHGSTDEHLGLNTGTMPIIDVCHALKQHSPKADLALEVNLESMHSSIEWLKKNEFI